MNEFYNFENLECWKQARDLAVDMYRISGTGNLNGDLMLNQQLRNSALQIMSHIAEGKEQGSAQEFIKCLLAAKAAAAALRSNLVVARAVGYLDEGDFLDFQDKATRASALIGGLINALKKRNKPDQEDNLTRPEMAAD